MAVWKEKNGWRTEIEFMGKKYTIGTFDTQEKAQSEYDRVKKAAVKIKEEERIKKRFGIPMNSFTEEAYSRGQGIKKVCIGCKSGSIQRVTECDIMDCEYWKFRPIPQRYIKGESCE